MRKRVLLPSVFLLHTLFATAVADSAESSPPPEYAMNTVPLKSGYTFKVNALWVNLNTSVWDPRKRTSVDNLTREDFVLSEDGVPQTVSDCIASESSFHLLMLLDVSASTTSFIDLLRQAVLRFSDQLKPTDRVAIMTFSTRAVMVQSFTSDRAKIRQAVRSIRPDGATAFYDALSLALRTVGEIPGRKAIVVFSDGVDNRMVAPGDGSWTSFPELQQKIREQDALVYTIFLTSERDRGDHLVERASQEMQMIAADSGARMYRPEKPSELSAAYAEVVNDLRHIYTLKYTPADTQAHGWRRLAVQVKGREGLLVRSRAGYYLD
ncbi:MAG: VWA domain-containing protein [Acidobacteriota bacterium]